MYTLSFKPAISAFGTHDPSAALLNDGQLVFAVEEERYTRSKHAVNEFPKNAIKACLDYEQISLSDIERIIIPYKPSLQTKIWRYRLKTTVTEANSPGHAINNLIDEAGSLIGRKFYQDHYINAIRERLSEIGTPLAKIETEPHHKCHAASAFYPTDYEESLVLTIDGKGEHDSTVIWKADSDGLSRVKTFEFPNSLGYFFGVITEFLGYHAFNGEGKVMGLAPYGNDNKEIRKKLKEVIDVGADYDVTDITKHGIHGGVKRLETILARSSKDRAENFTSWEKDLAHVAQSILEQVTIEMVKCYVQKFDLQTVCLAGGVALNCKMNRVIEQSEAVDELFVQPVANDAGLALGGGMLTSSPEKINKLSDVYWGPEYDANLIETIEETKIQYHKPANVIENTAKQLAEGKLIGWFQGRLELGPRALGNRSILADPRTTESRNKVNKYVKHREEWRPFAPSLKEESVPEYLEDAKEAPFMIKTYKVRDSKKDKIPAVLHPADGTTRPQTVREDQNPRYYELLSEFEELTGVPVLLNTSFNDHAEPIVNKPIEAIKDFYAMGLDTLVLGDYMITKG